MLNIDEIKARTKTATPGPWKQTRPSGEYVENDENFNVCLTRRSNDAAFIAHARHDIPDLLDEVERLTTDLEAAVADLSAAKVCAVCKRDEDGTCGDYEGCNFKWRGSR
jgi:hypothetical protein